MWANENHEIACLMWAVGASWIQEFQPFQPFWEKFGELRDMIACIMEIPEFDNCIF